MYNITGSFRIWANHRKKSAFYYDIPLPFFMYFSAGYCSSFFSTAFGGLWELFFLLIDWLRLFVCKVFRLFSLSVGLWHWACHENFVF